MNVPLFANRSLCVHAGAYSARRTCVARSANKSQPRTGRDENGAPQSQDPDIQPKFKPSMSTSRPESIRANKGPGNRAKLKLMSGIAGTNRGSVASLSRHRVLAKLLLDVCKENPTADAFQDDMVSLNGTWELLYSTCEPFRSSPFFWAFQEGLIQDRDMAAAIFNFTDRIPGATIGRVVQKIDMKSKSLLSEVEMTIFPGISGTVVTASSITGTGMEADVNVSSTRVDSDLFAPILDNVVVPVRDLLERVRGSGSAAVKISILYLDEDMRVMRTEDGQMFVYGRPI